jgi:uncharacterized protein (TIRG00374 family)
VTVRAFVKRISDVDKVEGETVLLSKERIERSSLIALSLGVLVLFVMMLPVGYPLVLTQLVAITPGGLGVREGIVAIVASVYGIEMGVSVLAVGIDRLVATSVILVLGTVFIHMF